MAKPGAVLCQKKGAVVSQLVHKLKQSVPPPPPPTPGPEPGRWGWVLEGGGWGWGRSTWVANGRTSKLVYKYIGLVQTTQKQWVIASMQRLDYGLVGQGIIEGYENLDTLPTGFPMRRGCRENDNNPC